jgi:uridine kinase
MLIIGIAGGSGSGKTTFTKKVLTPNLSEVALVHLDSYYLSPIPKEIFHKGRPNYDHPDSFDWNLLFNHLELIIRGQKCLVPDYDFKTNSRIGYTQEVGPAKVLILEGIYTLHDQRIRDLCHIKCFLDVDSDIRFSRRLHRDLHERSRTVESILQQYYETVRPMHNQYIEIQKTFADIIVKESNDVAAGVLRSKIIHFMSEKVDDPNTQYI